MAEDILVCEVLPPTNDSSPTAENYPEAAVHDKAYEFEWT